jgi:hypothetical protein
MQLGHTDAAWANRLDNSSQGGYLLFIMDEGVLQTGEARPLAVLDWAMRKLLQVCRSSLAAEVQAACIAVDALERAKVSIGAFLNPGRSVGDETMCH